MKNKMQNTKDRKDRKEGKRDVLRFILNNILKPFRREVLSTIFFITIGSFLTVSVPYVYGTLFDLILKEGVIEIVASFIVLWCILDTLSSCLSEWASAEGNNLSYKISTAFGAKALSHLVDLPMSFHKKKKIGEIFNKVDRSIWRLDRVLNESFTFLSSFLVLLFSIAVILFIKWYLGLIVIFVFFVSIFLTLKGSIAIVEKGQKVYDIWDKIYGMVYDKVTNPFLVKAFAKEEKEKREIQKSFVTKTSKPYFQMIYAWRNLTLSQRVISTLCYVILLSAAMLLIRSGELTPGGVLMFFGYIHLALTPFFHLNYMWASFQETIVPLKKTINLLKLATEKYEYGKSKLKKFYGKVTFEDVWFSYFKKKGIINGVSFEVKPGEVVGIVGESGVGKTTLAELLMGFYKPQKGKILFNDINIRKFDLKWLRDQIGIVSQEISLFNDTVKNNLLYAKPKASFREIVNVCKEAYSHDFIQKFPKKYNQIVGERGIKLSVGQKQRIMIAMALLKSPKILILDEPTAALDPVSEKMVEKGLKKLMKGKTVFIIAHRLSTLRICDKIIVLYKGKVVEIGNHNELMKKKKIYYKYYTLQTGLI